MIRASGRWLRRLLGFALAFAVFVTLAAGMFAWRLAQGPLSVPPLARMLENRAAEGGLGVRLTIGEATLVWEGFGEAVDRPLDIRLTDLRALDADGASVAEIPEGSVSLGLRALLLGRLEPRAIELRRVRLTLMRAEDGTVTVDLGADPATAGAAPDDTKLAAALLAGLGTVPEGRRWIGALQRVRIRGAELAIIDRQLGATWYIPGALLDLHRQPDGGVAVALFGAAVAGEARVRLSARGTLAANASGTLEVAVAPVAPADLAAALPALASLAALDAPLSGSVRLAFAPLLALESARITARLGEGRAHLPGGGTLPIASARAELALETGRVTVTEALLELPATHGPAPRITASGSARRDGAAWAVQAEAHLDQVAFADLPALWPEGLGTGERAWITGNITAGTVTGARFTLGVRIDADGAVEPVSLAGEITAEGATVHYLRPMPPATGVAARATVGLDKVTVVTRGGAVGAIRPTDATIVLSGLDTRPQWADIAVRIESPVPAAMELIAHPKLALFARRAPPPRGITGRGEVDLALRFPLLDALTVDQIEARATAEVTEAGVPDVVLGKSLTEGRITLEATESGLKLEGTGKLAGLQTTLAYDTDFRAGPASQIIERATLRLAPQEGVAAAFGIDLAPHLTGPVGGEARLAARRDGQSTVTLHADLSRARLAVRELGWSKPEGRAASAEATLRLAGPRLVAAELTKLEGPGLAARARASFTREGRVEQIEVPELRLGETRLAGEIRPPGRDGEPWRISARGALLDLSDRPRGSAETAAGATPPFALDARLDRVVLGPGRDTRNVTVSIRHDGSRVEALNAEGAVGDRGRYTATIRRDGAVRRLELATDDAGAVLAALHVIDSMAGGRLAVRGTYDDSQPSAPLTGEATIEEFRLRDAPAIGRLLQAMTLYGLLEVARGPGLSFTNLIAPFSLSNDVLELRDARAYGPSLGFTAKGTVDLARDTLAVEGTIVPAYFFNSLLGHIPLIGRLFSPERGGGVFAATYRVRGPFADPEVSVNPLAALTPGFLRGLFGFLGDGADAPAPEPDPHGMNRGGG
ncbi:AsmA-like C-terminal region-containing protein [Elioraea tepidiphila]|uniref:YhdP family protein n=1 Tax=Elioraea tepidiphila TaxID=457934 RepID=UPI0003673DA8|nr:AsmA-like C-terminal region-containing protein [Elioraea tepidiphila]